MILTLISLSLFAGFVIFCVCKFGLKDCYSAYGPIWRDLHPRFNVWSAVTTLSALILVPALLDASDGSAWQFTGFFCPALIAIVGLTPDYDKYDFVLRVHSVCAKLGALYSILYILLTATAYWWTLVAYIVLATVMTLIKGKWSWVFWFEMAAYASIYTIMLLIVL